MNDDTPAAAEKRWLYIALRLRRIDATVETEPRLLDRIYLLLNDDRAILARADIAAVRDLFQDPKLRRAIRPLAPRIVEGTHAKVHTWICEPGETASVAMFTLEGGALYGVLVAQEHSDIYEDGADLLPILGAVGEA